MTGGSGANAPERVLVAGGGVAALEAALALRALAPELVAVELLCPDDHFSYRPLAVAEPFTDSPEVRIPLAELARDAGFSRRAGRLARVDPAHRRALTAAGEVIDYDVLVLATGARPVVAIPGALTFRGPEDVSAFTGALKALQPGRPHSIAFVVPAQVAWTLPLYELALMTAAWADEHERQLTISLVTPELRPLAIFGAAASAHVDQLLREADIELQTATIAERFSHGRLWIAGKPSRAVDLAVAVPALEGPALERLPHDPLGFVPVDRLGRVEGVEDVYAAGDVTNHRIKQGGLAAEQAEAAASAIAANAGAHVLRHPYEPVLRAALLTGDRPRYLRRTPSRAPSASALRDYPLWWPDHKIAGRRLAVHLARHHDRELRTWTDEAQPFPRAP